jgi:hypothetical protein
MTSSDSHPYARVTDLSPEQLNEHLARWFGMAPMENDPMPWKPTWDRGTRGTDDYTSYWPGPPPFASELKQAAEAEVRLLAEGHAERYGQVLYLILHGYDTAFDEYDTIGGKGYAALATAPALVRAQAVLEVLAQLDLVKL